MVLIHAQNGQLLSEIVDPKTCLMTMGDFVTLLCSCVPISYIKMVEKSVVDIETVIFKNFSIVTLVIDKTQKRPKLAKIGQKGLSHK